MITIYDYVLSANCYKVRLLLSMLDLEYRSIPVDFHPGKEHKGAEFRRINPMGHIPVIDDDGFVLRDAHAILVYLAAEYDAKVEIPTARSLVMVTARETVQAAYPAVNLTPWAARASMWGVSCRSLPL